MESIIIDHITRKLVGRPELLPLTYDSPLLVSGILDSLSVHRLVPFQEAQSGFVIAAEDPISPNFEMVVGICAYSPAQDQGQEVLE